MILISKLLRSNQSTRSCEYFHRNMFTHRVHHTDYSYPFKQTALTRIYL